MIFAKLKQAGGVDAYINPRLVNRTENCGNETRIWFGDRDFVDVAHPVEHVVNELEKAASKGDNVAYQVGEIHTLLCQRLP